MSLVLADRVRQTTTSTGTGTITLDGSVDGFQSFAVIGNNNTTYYTIAGGTQWEVGIGTYFSGTLARTTIISSSTGSILNLAAGVKDVFVTLPAENTVTSIASSDGSVIVTTTGSVVDLAVSQTSPASVLVEQVRNSTGATLTKGTAVYISGATGQLPTVSKALATSDATSAQTLGLITSDLANNSNGYVTIIGLISNLDTSAYTDGAQLYLSPTTAGTLTATKPYAPQHLVYMAVVAHAHPTQGKLLVKVQNGYELDELHNVSAQSPTTGQTIVWNGTTSLWEKNTVSLITGVNGTLPIANGGTGQTTLAAASIATYTGTETLTNKTLTAPTIASANLTTALTLAGAAGTNGQVLTSAGSGLPSWTTIASGLSAATQAQMETATSNTVAVTPLSTNWHPGVAKCWLVTAGAGTPSITASRNITSITDDGVGLLTVTIATDFSSDQIASLATARVGAGSTPYFVAYNSASGGSGQLKAYAAGVAFDVDGYTFAAFGDQP